MMLFRGKRGFGKKGSIVEPMFWLLDLIMILLVLNYSSRYIDQFAEKTTFEREFLARDVGLTLDTVYDSPGNILLSYPDTLWFSFAFREGQVNVFEGKKLEIGLTSRYPFTQSNGRTIERTLVPLKDVTEIKKSSTPVVSNLYSEYPEVGGDSSVPLRFVSVGDVVSVDKMEERVLNINTIDCEMLGKKGDYGKEFSQKIVYGGIKDELLVVRGVSPKVLVLIKYVETKDKTNNIKAYVPIGQKDISGAKYLGCRVINGVLNDNDLTKFINDKKIGGFNGASVVPIDVGTGYSGYVIALEIGDKGILDQLYNKALNSAIGHSIEEALVR